MPNRLIKQTKDELILVPYITPAQPARTVFERRTVCGMRYSVPGTYTTVVDPVTGNATLQFKPTTPVVDGSLRGVWTCQPELVQVTYPATPAVVENRLVARSGFNLGWNAGGRSEEVVFGDGYAEFKVRGSVAGAIVGLNADDSTPGEYRGNVLDFAFYLHDGRAQVMENGVIKSASFAYTSSTVFRVARAGSTVTYLMDGVTRYTHSSASTAPVWLEAALFAAYDEVFDPTLVQTGSDAPENNMVLALDLAALDLYFKQPGNFLELDLAALVFGFEQSLPEPSFNYLDFNLPAIDLDFSLLMGAAMDLDLDFSAVQMLFADHRYAELDLDLSAVDMILNAYEGNYNATLGAVGLGQATMSPATLLFAFMSSGGRMNTAMVVQTMRDASMDARGFLDSVLSLTSVQDALMSTVGSSATSLGVPAGEMQTLVVNLEGFGNTSYSAFYFNSFARLGNRYLGAGAGGIVELQGDTDDGAAIAARVHLGRKDFGNAQRKTVVECFLGMSGEDDLVLRVTPVGGRSYSYRTNGHSPSLRQERVKVGKGLEANYFDLEIFNQEGADFEIDALQLQVADLQRKI